MQDRKRNHHFLLAATIGIYMDYTFVDTEYQFKKLITSFGGKVLVEWAGRRKLCSSSVVEGQKIMPQTEKSRSTIVSMLFM